jgi:TP901 family phage tail tape measure protein
MARQRILKVTIAGDAKSLGAAFGAAETRAQQFAAKMKSVAKVGSAALIGIGAVSVKSFAGFDDAMTKSLSIMGDVSDAQRDRMVKAAREMAKQSTFSAEQAAESYFFLASAGLSAEQSIAALPQVTKFAQAGAFDLALATDLLTDAQSALGLSSDDTATSLRNMAKVGDVLVKANTLANASVQQFSEALTTKAGAALKAVGKDIEEGVAVLAVFADQGIKGAEAGTALGIVMRDLQTKAIKNKEAWEQLGVAAFDANGEMRNIADIIGGLETALAGMSDQQQKATLLQLGFSDKSVSFITALLG